MSKRPSGHSRSLNVTAERLRLAQLADTRATLNGQSFSDYVFTLIEDDLRKLPADLKELEREVQQVLRALDNEQRKKLDLPA